MTATGRSGDREIGGKGDGAPGSALPSPDRPIPSSPYPPVSPSPRPPLRDRLSRLRGRLTLPLFLKELTEASARRRTYVVRTIYAVALFLLAILFARDELFPSGDAFAVLGRGGTLYVTVILIQFGGVYLFLPALTAASITAEKERNTLGLLFLTKLSPTKVVFEKYLGRVFPMLCLALLSLPLLAVAYSLGGLEFDLLFEGIVRLTATILMIGAIGVACSAWCRTTAGAFLMTYAVLALLFPGPIFVLEALRAVTPGNPANLLTELASSMRLVSGPDPDIAAGIFFGPLTLLIQQSAMQQGYVVSVLIEERPPWLVLWQTIPLLFITAVALVAARLSLVRRAEVKPKRYLARAFAALDSRFREWNDRYARGIEIIRTRGSLPEDAPIAWRETTKTPLGSMRYLVRLLLLIQVPVLFFGVTAAGSYNPTGSGMLSAVAGLLWLACGLLAAVKGSGLFTGERARQSLDVLLTTPIPAREILRQKLAGLWRLIAVCAVPILTTYWLIGYMHYGVSSMETAGLILYLLVAISVTFTHLALPAFLALLVGLRIPTQSRAMLTSVALLVALCMAGPLVRLVVTAGSSGRYYDEFSILSLYSPAAVMSELMGARLSIGNMIYLLIGNTAVYGGIAFALWLACDVMVPKWLGRGENELYRPEMPRPTLPHPEPERPQPAEVAG